MRKKVILIPLLLLIFFVFTTGCVSQEGAHPTPVIPTTTLPPLVTTPMPVSLLETTVTVNRDAFSSWEFSLHIGNRYTVEVVTDGAPVDLLVLDAANYRLYTTAFYSRSGSPWESYVILIPGVVQDHVEFKVPLAGRYRVIIENADIIPGGAVTTRDVTVVIRVYDLA
jgi:hypothetical protein